MTNINIEKSMNSAEASLAMEGLSVDEQTKKWCRMLLKKEISMEEYISLVKKKAGVSA